jgi:methionyl-tRNA formyltransferase
VDWSKPASDVYNLIRGCDPQPGAYSTIKGSQVRFCNARLLEATTDKVPGEIVDIDAGTIVVALDGGSLGIGKIRDAAGAKMDAADFARNAGLQVGMKFSP